MNHGVVPAKSFAILASILGFSQVPGIAYAETATQIAAAAKETSVNFCTACLRIRVGLPRIARGPSADAVDMPFTALSAHFAKRG